jgi:hypothetical protein
MNGPAAKPVFFVSARAHTYNVRCTAGRFMNRPYVSNT